MIVIAPSSSSSTSVRFGSRPGGYRAGQQAVYLVMFAQAGLVEPLHERAAVIPRLQDAVMFELHQRLLHRDAAQSEGGGDLVAVHPVAGPQPAGQQQLEDVGYDLVFLLTP